MCPQMQRQSEGSAAIYHSREITMDTHIDFGHIGLRIGDAIQFDQRPEIRFIVGSGNGRPGQSGTMVQFKNGRETGYFSLRYMTRKLMGYRFKEDQDIFELWSHRGKTLRAIYNEKYKPLSAHDHRSSAGK